MPSGPVSSREDRAFVRFNGHAEAEEAAALALGLDDAGDHRERLATGDKPERVPIGQFRVSLGPVHEVGQESFASGFER